MSKVAGPGRWIREQQVKVERMRLVLGDLPQVAELEAIVQQMSNAVSNYQSRTATLNQAAREVGIKPTWCS